jgi:hypothetical protein
MSRRGCDRFSTGGRFPKPGENLAAFEHPVETAQRKLDAREMRRNLPRLIVFCELPSYTDKPHFSI